MRLLCLLAVICCLSAAPARSELLLSGSSTVLPVVRHAAAEFALSTGIQVKAVGGGSDRGVEEVSNGRVQIGMVSRALHEGEARQLQAHVIGYDGIALFVHERNGLTGLTRPQVTDIFTGRLRHWREIDPAAPDGRIFLVGKSHGGSTRKLFDDYFGLRGQDYPSGTYIIGTNLAATLFVSIDPYSISYVSIGSLTRAREMGAPVKLLTIDGIVPTAANVAAGRYPYKRPLLLVTRGTPTGEAQRFIAWLQGKAGQRVVEAEGFLSSQRGEPQ